MKLLLTGAFKATEEQLNNIRSLGYEIIFMKDERGDIPCDYEKIDGVICNGLFLYHDIKKFSALKFIQLTSAGFDRVPMDEAKRRGIKVFNARGVYSIPMAEYAVWGVLSLYKRGRFFENNRNQKKWEKHRSIPEIFGKTVGIIGCGNVGYECAIRFKAFGANILGVDLFERTDEVFGKIYEIGKIEEVLPCLDVVVLTLPLTESTKGLMGEENFSFMKDGSVLVNISRGAIVGEKALLKALKEKLFGAVLDVFETEPLDEKSELWNLENVILTPHNSFVGEGNGERLSKVVIKNLEGIK